MGSLKKLGIGLVLALGLSGCLPGADGARSDLAAVEATPAGPDAPRPKARPGGGRAAAALSQAALQPPAPLRTPDEADDLIAQPKSENDGADGPERTAGRDADPEGPAEPKLPEALRTKPEPPPIPTALQGQARQCTASKGNFVRRGETGTFVCVRPTRDANRQCSDSDDCEGICFAKSRTCAPALPLFGCYDALEAGRVVKICVE